MTGTNDIVFYSEQENYLICLFCLFGLMLYIPVNSYGHVGTVSSPNHTFSLVTDNNPS